MLDRLLLDIATDRPPDRCHLSCGIQRLHSPLIIPLHDLVWMGVENCRVHAVRLIHTAVAPQSGLRWNLGPPVKRRPAKRPLTIIIGETLHASVAADNDLKYTETGCGLVAITCSFWPQGLCNESLSARFLIARSSRSAPPRATRTSPSPGHYPIPILAEQATSPLWLPDDKLSRWSREREVVLSSSSASVRGRFRAVKPSVMRHDDVETFTHRAYE